MGTPTPPGLPAVDARGVTPPGGRRAATASPPGGVPVTVHAGSSTPGGVAAAPRVAAPAVEPPLGLPSVPDPMRPAYAAYTYAVPLPVPLNGDARYLRPGFALPRGAAGLTTTHVIPRRDRGWLVSLLAAAVVLATAAAVIFAVGNSRATARESGGAGVLRVTPDTAPAGAGPATPDPVAGSPAASTPR